MFGLNHGELFVVVFVFLAVVSAPLWPRLGEALFVFLFGGKSGKSASDESGARSDHS